MLSHKKVEFGWFETGRGIEPAGRNAMKHYR